MNGATQRYHTEYPSHSYGSCSGSSASSVACSFVPATEPDSPAIGWAFAKSSFAGGVGQGGGGIVVGSHESVNGP